MSRLVWLGAGAVLGIVLTKLADHTISAPKSVTNKAISNSTNSATPTPTTTTSATPAASTSATALAISDPPTLRFQRFGKNELLLGIEHTSRIFKSRVLVMGTVSSVLCFIFLLLLSRTF